MPRGAKARPVSRDRDKNPTENYIFLDIDSRGCSARERDQSNGPIARNNNNAPMSLFGASAESRVCNFSGYIGARARARALRSKLTSLPLAAPALSSLDRERERERERELGVPVAEFISLPSPFSSLLSLSFFAFLIFFSPF
jgi:hypothetical protein